MENIISLLPLVVLILVISSLTLTTLALKSSMRTNLNRSRKLITVAFIFDNIIILIEAALIFFNLRSGSGIIVFELIIAFNAFLCAKRELKIIFSTKELEIIEAEIKRRENINKGDE